MRASNLWALAGLILLLGGCASPPQPTSSQPEPQTNSNEADNTVNRLKAGETVNITTSQGNISVTPTVVAIGDNTGNTGSPDSVVYNDPLEGFNRAMFDFNHVVYQYVIFPVSDGYRYVVPNVAREKVGNVFANLREPLNLLSNLAAGEVSDAGTNVGRFLINSTIGLLGIFDPATAWFDLPEKKQTIADTLQHYDVGAGTYIVLPILGSSDARGSVSLLAEGMLHPINQLADKPESYQIRIVEGFNDLSSQTETYRILYQQAEDPYLYFRNQYIQGQRRNAMFEANAKENAQKSEEKTGDTDE